LSTFNPKIIAQYAAPIRILVFLLTLVMLWAPWAGSVYTFFNLTRDMSDPGVINLLNIWVMGGLAVLFLLFLPWWKRRVDGQLDAFRSIGLVSSRRNWLGFLGGWLNGLVSTMAMFALQGALGWLIWQPIAIPWPELIIGGLLSSIGVALAEELFFRGWLLQELEADYSLFTALTANSLIFAALHFMKPLAAMWGSLPQFPGLTILGVVLVLAKRSQKNLLGIAIGLHSGMTGAIYLVNVGQLVKYTGTVSDWMTGINGAPHAGLLGIIALTILAGYFAWVSRTAKSLNVNSD
jgi:uncharacterized protein